ncbi:MAG TPA: hypothetical protein VII02_12790 [Gemmatimonadaceae bacterium]
MAMLHPPFAHPGSPRRVSPQVSGEVTPNAGMPGIEEFLDELPLIDDFLFAPGVHTESAATAPAAPVSPQMQSEAEGWADADWQSYDWSRLASLGAPEPEAAEAHAAWSSTSWDSTSRRFSVGRGRRGPSSGDEVAAALDEIARRIRTGELSLEEFQGKPPEAAIAALFAAFLRNKG